MKRYVLNVVLLLVMHTAYAMDLVKVDEEKCLRIGRYLAMTERTASPKEREDRKTFFAGDHTNNPEIQQILKDKEIVTAAINFIGRIPDIKFCEVRAEFAQLYQKIASEVELLSGRNVLVCFSLHKDVFAVLCKNHLPESFDDESGFFDPSHHKGVQISDPYDQKKDEINKPTILDNKNMTEQLQKMPFGKALYGFNYASRPKKSMQMITQREVSTDDCLKGCIIKRVGERNKITYVLTYEEYIAMSAPLRKLLDDIIGQSGQKYADGGMSFKITDEHVTLMHSTMEELSKDKPEELARLKALLNKKIFVEAKIRVDIPSATFWQKIKDRFLFGFPFFVVTIIPDFVNRQATGLFETLAGGVVCVAGSSIFGEYVYPFVDSYNFNVDGLSKWYGVNNHRRLKRGSTFLCLSAVNYVCSAIGQKFWSYGTIPWRLVGATIHIVRMVPSTAILAYLEEYSALSKRRNDDGKSHTFGRDLLNGPKFNQQNRS
ncbi:MAG TPA: hypothetical protein VJ201_03645 [Candidatus Babeliales bacterium]|nr:hypothetical protein [Candidatus Babeliales bacterium]